MHLYQVTVDNQKTANVVEERLDTLYPGRYYLMQNGVSWVCGLNGGTTTAAFAQSVLNINADTAKGEKIAGLVVRINNYKGFTAADLWENIEAWNEASS